MRLHSEKTSPMVKKKSLYLYRVFTQEVPDEDVLKESWRLEAVLEHLLQSPHQSVLSTQEESQAASLWGAATKGKADTLVKMSRLAKVRYSS